MPIGATEFNYGANHRIIPGHFIGASLDPEGDGQPTIHSDGDDTADMAGEDVLTGTYIVMAEGPTINLELSADHEGCHG